MTADQTLESEPALSAQRSPSTDPAMGEFSVRPPGRTLDIATIIGLVCTFSLIGVAIYIGNQSQSNSANFFNVPAVLIVVLGTVAVTTTSFSLLEMANMFRVAGQCFFKTVYNPARKAHEIIDIALLARKRGLLAVASLETELMRDPLVSQAVFMATDGYNADDIERVLSQEIDALVRRHRRSAQILRRAAEVAPAMGLIGTLVGLVQMLANLQEPDQIGPAMAVALLTTFYGAILGTVVFAPFAEKLERKSAAEAKLRQLLMIGVSSIARQENPRRIEMLLNSELSPQNRIKYFD